MEAVHHLLQGIVDYPDEVQVIVDNIDGIDTIVAKVNPEDLGKVIGRGGKTANSFRTIIGSISNHKYRFDIIDGS